MNLDNDLMDKWLEVRMGADAAYCRALIEEIQSLRDSRNDRDNAEIAALKDTIGDMERDLRRSYIIAGRP